MVDYSGQIADTYYMSFCPLTETAIFSGELIELAQSLADEFAPRVDEIDEAELEELIADRAWQERPGLGEDEIEQVVTLCLDSLFSY